MTPRLLLLRASSPSPLRALSSRTPLNLRTPTHRRGVLTFPHPDLDPEHGHTKFVIRSLKGNIPSMLHVYTIIKALERKLKVEVLDFTVQKDFDTFQPTSNIFLTTLKPVHLDNALLMEIPFDGSKNTESNFLGGPSLNDIARILNTPSSSSSSSIKSSSGPTTSDSNTSIQSSSIENDTQGKGKGTGSAAQGVETLQIRVEIQKNTRLPTTRMSKSKRQRYPQNGREASDIVKSLRNFKGGFYGGFEGLAEKFDHLAIEEESSSNPSSNNVEEEVKSQSQ
ncbi:uncharacterized protein I303_105529 [Kwoniella dejecticola CBS 10117]|uniref:Uncharacterized protein n=1 Tax=Kwoniella dejecticola CBS 10117 TaxID=1296121 RepID=A0A1A6A280_9TREE|nr:uncharacterized protein I303_05029 [Kwoniella dejecticola CBS 10117]OBR84172.1 hypothetical protein I303_05029 [Kwoniella dejecticola CBS 10117]